MFGDKRGIIFMRNLLCLRFGYLGVLGVTADSCLHFQSCLRNDGQSGGPPRGLQDFLKMPEKHALVPQESFLSMPMDRRHILNIFSARCINWGNTNIFI